MAKSLVIVESPAKAKTIGKYLGNQYIVKASLGHIKDELGTKPPDQGRREVGAGVERCRGGTITGAPAASRFGRTT